MKRICEHTESDPTCKVCSHYDGLARNLPALREAIKRQGGVVPNWPSTAPAAGQKMIRFGATPPPQGNLQQTTVTIPQWKGGVGTEYHNLTDRLGVPACRRCIDLAMEMDTKGIGWCKDNYDYLLKETTERYENMKWADWFRAGIQAVKEGLPKSPRGMLDYAIELAEKNL
jgi:hypothetical protein